MRERLKSLISDILQKFIGSFFLIILVFVLSGLCQNTLKEILVNITTIQKIEIIKKVISDKNTKVLPDITIALDDPSAEVRILASEALLNFGDASFISAYQQELFDSHWQVRLNGIKAIVKWAKGDEVLECFKSALNDSHWQVRYWTAVGIGKFGDETMLKPLISHLNDENLQVRAELFWALKRILGRDEAIYAFKKLSDSYISAIKEATQVDDVKTLVNAIWALEASNDSRVVPILLNFLNNNSDEVKIQTVWALENLKANEGFEFLRAKMLEPSIKLKIETIKTLVRLNDKDAVTALISSLDDEDENVKIFALWALKEFNDPSCYSAIVKKLADVSEKVSKYAYDVILSLKNPDFVPFLEDAFLNDEFSINAKVMAIELLGKIGSSEEAVFFNSVKAASLPVFRKTILLSWYNINPDDSEFLSYLNFASRLDPADSVKTAANNILKQIIKNIEKDIQSAEEIKRSQALERLSFLKESPLIIPLIKKMLYSQYQDVYAASLELIPYQPKSAVFKAMREILQQEESYEIKKLAILAMGKAHLKEAAPLLQGYLKNDDPEIQMYAAYSLALIGNKSGLGVALQNIQNPDIQIQGMAVETIAFLDADIATAKLLRILENSELDVKLKAAWALSRFGEEKGLYTLINISRQDIEPLRTQARYYLSDKKIPSTLRKKIPEIQHQQEIITTGVPETALKSIVAIKISSPPVIDGAKNDRCWRFMFKENMSMIYTIGEKVPSEVQTSILTAYDDKNIYFLFTCMDPEAKSITFDSQDFLTICLNPMSSGDKWYQYTIHATNFLRFAYVWKKYFTEDQDSAWQSQWQTATSITDKNWVAEIAIPWSDFGLTKSLEQCEINFQRISDHLPTTTWTGKIDNPAQFGQIVFGKRW